MISQAENIALTQVGPGSPMGDLMRRYWMPALLSWELPEADGEPVRVKLLGEQLVAFRDSRDASACWKNFAPTAWYRCGWDVMRNAACAACTTVGNSMSTGSALT